MLHWSGTDEQAVINLITARNNEQRQRIKLQFKTMYGKVKYRESMFIGTQQQSFPWHALWSTPKLCQSLPFCFVSLFTKHQQFDSQLVLLAIVTDWKMPQHRLVCQRKLWFHFVAFSLVPSGCTVVCFIVSILSLFLSYGGGLVIHIFFFSINLSISLCQPTDSFF